MTEDNNDLMTQRIKELRIKKGLSQEQLAELLGLQKSAIAKYENGRVINIKRSTISNMAKIFNCNPSYIMGWEDSNQVEIRKKIHGNIIEANIDGINIQLEKNYHNNQETLYRLIEYCYKLLGLSDSQREILFGMIDNMKIQNQPQEYTGNCSHETTYLDNNLSVKPKKKPTLLAAHEDNNASEDDKKSDIKLLKDYKSNKKGN